MCVWDHECEYYRHSPGFSCNPTVGTKGYRKYPFQGEIKWMVLDRSNLSGDYLNAKGLTRDQWVEAMIKREPIERCGKPVTEIAPDQEVETGPLSFEKFIHLLDGR